MSDQMLYPSYNKVPHDKYSDSEARQAQHLAENILKKAQKFYVRNHVTV